MTERKPCIRCQRQIDAYARSCPFCNWDQSETPSGIPETPASNYYVPPPDNRARNRLIGLCAFVTLVIVAFVVGTFIHGFEAAEAKAAQTKYSTAAQNLPATAPLRSNVTLVPVNDTGPLAPLETPITSAPPQAPGQQPNDATALPADQYAAVAAKAKAQKKAASIDPRTLTGRAYEEPEAPASLPFSESRRRSEDVKPVERTEPFPEYEPLPHIHVDRDTTARLTLTIGPDGHVKDIDVNDSIPGETSKLIESVQNWRFRPATQNGIPVTARVSVTITLHPDE